MEHAQCLIIGAGPAGLSAAIYTARAGVDTLVLGCDPKVAGDYDIDNYFGFPETITGKELIERGAAQARRFGASLRCERVLGAHYGETDGFMVKTDKNEYAADSIIIAAGVARVRPGISNIADYEGKGVSYCVSCDGFFYRGKTVAVLGEGDYAANQALELTTFTPNVTIYTQGKAPTITGDFSERLAKANIPVHQETLKTLSGEPALTTAHTNDGRDVPVDGIFVAMGQASALDFAKALGLPLRGAFIDADHEQKTGVPGVFAAGDCVGRFLQISVAVGEGAKAGKSAIAFLKETGKAGSARS
ncbi:MAG: NAD(P)/FAD-dependent oxidoreductase [Desulfovibrionaceae bacterium]|nr:NAD(P)/FAD-dependent oxidoreductase [Desulfovibrionaceae bacterium]